MTRDFVPEDDGDSSYRYTNREEDTREALQLIEEALGILAGMGAGASIDRVQDLLNRAYVFLDRHYSGESEYENERELDFSDEAEERLDDEARWN